jgi:hypothetical protein
MSDGDSKNKIQLFKSKMQPKKECTNIVFIPWQLLFAVWVRCVVQADNGLDRFLLDYGRNFLSYFGIILYIIYFIEKYS